MLVPHQNPQNVGETQKPAGAPARSIYKLLKLLMCFQPTLLHGLALDPACEESATSETVDMIGE